MKVKKIFLFITLQILICFNSFASNDLSLLDQPAANAKTVATIKSGQTIVPFFSQGQWVKVGDPSNGNVGWINQETLQNAGYPIASIQISANNKDITKQMNTMLTDMEKQQGQMQKQLQQLLQQNIDMIKQMLKN